MEIKTCSRCKGTGNTGHHVVHCGIPGGCYKCDMAGKVVVLTVAERLAFEVQGLAAHKNEIAKMAGELKDADNHLWLSSVARAERRGATPKTKEEWTALYGSNDELNALRVQYRALEARRRQLEAGEAKPLFARTVTMSQARLLA